jgi:hypothetical protein
MVSRRTLALVTAALVATGSVLAQTVKTPGSGTSFPVEQPAGKVGGREVKLVLTGCAVRQKLLVNVYSIGSYVAGDAGVKSAEQLASADCLKRLHLIMERTVDGKDMAEAFRAAIRMNYPEPQFTDEVNKLVQFMRNDSARKYDHIALTHIPGIGLHCVWAGKADFLIKNTAFSKAVWDIYLGKKNLGESIKQGLTSRL